MVNLNTSLAKILSSKSKYLLRHSSILRQHISYKSSYQPPSSHPFDGSSGPANRDLKSKNASPISKFHYTSNNEIEAYIANQTYGLEPRHLATIRARPVRSPYTNRQQILLWNEDLVKIKALEVYKNEQGILKAAARKKQIRKKQFEEITKYIESSNKQRKIIEENYKIRDAQLKDKSQRTTKLLNIIKKSGGLSYADLILDEVIQIYEDTSAKKSQKMKNSENKEFVIFDHKQNVVHRGSFEMGKLGVSAVASEKDVAEESQSSNDSEISATEDEQVLLPNLKSHGFASISRIERTGTNYSLRAQKVTLIAAITNAIITCWKLAVAIITNSATMYGEVYHSLGDTLMQLMLFMSHRYADKYKPSEKYPYGFKQLPQIASLASGIMIFSMGAVNSIAAGYHILAAPGNATASSVEALGATTQAITYPTAASSLTEIICNPFVVLGVSFVLESISLLTAYKEVRRNAREKNLTFYQQLKSGTDPTTSVVFLEDMAAVTGLMVAAGCLGLMEYSGSIIFDGVVVQVGYFFLKILRDQIGTA